MARRGRAGLLLKGLVEIQVDYVGRGIDSFILVDCRRYSRFSLHSLSLMLLHVFLSHSKIAAFVQERLSFLAKQWAIFLNSSINSNVMFCHDFMRNHIGNVTIRYTDNVSMLTADERMTKQLIKHQHVSRTLKECNLRHIAAIHTECIYVLKNTR